MRRVTPIDTDNLSNLFDDPEILDEESDEDYEFDGEDEFFGDEDGFGDDFWGDEEEEMEEDSLFREFDELPEAI